MRRIRSSYDAALETAATRAKAVLHRRHDEPVPGGGFIVSCTVRDALEYEETSSGIIYSHLGWRFNINVKES